jgi:hypothetical protein
MVITPDKQPMPTIGGSIATETTASPSAAPPGPASSVAPASSAKNPAAHPSVPKETGKGTR